MKSEEMIKYIKHAMCYDCGFYLGGGNCNSNCKVIEIINTIEAIDKIREIVDKWKSDLWEDTYLCMVKIAEFVKLQEKEVEE